MGLFSGKKAAAKITIQGRDGFGVPTQYHWSDRHTNLPSGGAAAYSFDTLQLPTYSPVGWGVIYYRGYNYQQKQVSILHGVPPNSLGNPGNLTGQMVNGSLITRTTRNPDQLTVVNTAMSYALPPGANT